jgi:hypothetical protein
MPQARALWEEWKHAKATGFVARQPNVADALAFEELVRELGRYSDGRR